MSIELMLGCPVHNRVDLALVHAHRREQVCKIHHVCPACHAVQVQLVSWFNPIVIRKCRICKHVHSQFIPMESEK